MHSFPQVHHLVQETVVTLAGGTPSIQPVFGGFAYCYGGSGIGCSHDGYLSEACPTGLPGPHSELPILYLSQ
jgi:hypothetical protein